MGPMQQRMQGPSFGPPPGMGPAGFPPPPGFQGGYPGFPPPKRGFGRFFIFLMVLILAGAIVFHGLASSVLFNLGVIAASAKATGKVAPETTLVDGDASQKIVVIPVTGVIMEESAEKFDRMLTQAEKDSAVKALVIAIDTPGGSATASDAMYHRLDKFKKDAKDAGKNIPVIISMGGMATSGGYYLACAGDYIFARPGTMTGNIGVILPRFNISKLFDKWGIEETTIASTGATYKNAGSMFQPENPRDTAYIQGLVDTTFTQFKDVVKAGRGSKLNGDPADLFSGKVFMGEEAKAKGLVDALGYEDDAYNYAASAASLKDKEVVKYDEMPSLLHLLGAESKLDPPKAEGRGVSVNGVTIDAKALEDLVAPRPLYLWRGE